MADRPLNRYGTGCVPAGRAAGYLVASAGLSPAGFASLLCVLFLACVDVLCPCDDLDFLSWCGVAAAAGASLLSVAAMAWKARVEQAAMSAEVSSLFKIDLQGGRCRPRALPRSA